MSYDQGDPIHGEIVSADASGGVTATLYHSSNLTAFTLGADEYITVTDVVYVNAVTGAFSFSFGADGAGTRIIKGTLDNLSGVAHHFETPRGGPKGIVPKLVAAAGQVDLVFCGYVTRV